MFVGLEISVNNAQKPQTKPKVIPPSRGGASPIKSPKRAKSQLIRNAIFDAQRVANTLVISEAELQYHIVRLLEYERDSISLLKHIKKLIEANDQFCTKKTILHVINHQPQSSWSSPRSPKKSGSFIANSTLAVMPTVTAKSPLLLAADKGQSEVALYFLEMCEKNQWIIPSSHNNILHYASQRGLTTLAQNIIDKLGNRVLINLTIDDKDEEGKTSLMWAAKTGKEKIVRLLLSQGAEWLLEDVNGHSALLLALMNHHKKVVDTFFELRKVNMQTIRNRCGKLVLDVLLSERKSEHVRFLYQVGVHVENSEEISKEPSQAASEPSIKNKRQSPSSPIFASVEVMMKILSNLDGIELGRMACVSKTMSFLTSNPELWKKLFEIHWGFNTTNLEGIHWRDIFRDNFLRESEGLDPLPPRPTWISDQVVERCQKCKSQFHFFLRRHHCRNCGRIFCRSCSLYRLILPALNYEKAVRVCGACYHKNATND